MTKEHFIESLFGRKTGKAPLFVQDKTRTAVVVKMVLMALVCLILLGWVRVC